LGQRLFTTIGWSGLKVTGFVFKGTVDLAEEGEVRTRY
jgi:hypothetical protein